ncbi:DUF4097 domain-containing protein [Eubacteriales bacterium OttesenSCG-928-K08]|nr:DUF4097 domain-containing protein [Eubacteriales bacterium OttesenSCG-928-K08]
MKSNKSVIARIIIWSLVALMLVGIMVVAISGGFNNIARPWRNINWGGLEEAIVGDYYSDSEKYVVGGANIAAGNIKKVEVFWISGDVNVSVGDTSTIDFSESYSRTLDPDYQMRYYVNGDTLIIQYCKSKITFKGISRGFGKNLTLTLPEGIDLERLTVESISGTVRVADVNAKSEVDISSVSGGMNIDNVSTGSIDIESVSGSIKMDGIYANYLDLENVSGNVEITNSELSNVDVESISGTVRVAPGADVRDLSVENVSGSIYVSLPENDGFTAYYSNASGSFKCDFAVEMPGKKVARYKNGAAQLDLSSASGGIYIFKE